MVYESDFYTTRRPYSRPLVSSYTVTYRPIILPLSSVIQLRSYHPHMPYVAHKRLVTIVHSPVHHVYYAGAMVPIRVRARVRPSVLVAELNRIRDLPRPSSRSYLEEYLNSRDHILFDDETRELRARMDSLLRRVHVFVPRAVASDFLEEIVPERMRSHDYVRRLLSGRNIAKKQVEHLGWYDVPERGTLGTLACVKFVAGKPQSVRKPYFKVADLRPADIRNDVNFLSYYSKNRQAAASACPGQPLTERELRKARAFESDEYTPQQEKTSKSPKHAESRPKQTQPPPPLGQSSVVHVHPVHPVVNKAEAEKRSRKRAEAEKESEPILESQAEAEPEPAKEPEPIAEAAKEPEPIAEPQAEAAAPVKPSKASLKASKSAKHAKAAKAAEPKAEAAPEVEAAKAPEPAKEPEEPAKEAEPVPPEPAAAEVSAEEPIAESEGAQAVSDEAKEDEDENVRREKEDAIRRAEEYLRKVAQEAQSEEERRKVAEAERVELEMEEKKAWEALQLAQERKAELNEILENERKEVERKEEEAKLEAEREEAERVVEEERIINQTRMETLIHEQERLIVEEHLEEVQQQKQEQEERMADVAQPAEEEPKDVSCAEDPATIEMTDQEREEKPYEATTDDETRVEEENVPEEEHPEVTETPFVEEPEGAEGRPQTGPMASEDAPQIEEVTSGGEEEFEWGDQDV
ncbi:probable serine/threonine-protein kinase kinX isoform X1 [Harpegnathos saltator]|nr:probable serine/threonine-protein kinase kinX isoform X1 [Harpegnathos saltator]